MDCASRAAAISFERRSFQRELHVAPEDAHILSFNVSRRPWRIWGSYCTHNDASPYHLLGDLSLLPAGVGMHAVGDDSGADLFFCRFDATRFADTLGRLSSLQPDLISPCLDIRHRDIVRGVERLYEEMSNPNINSDALIDSLVTTLAIDLARLPQDGRRDALSGQQLLALDNYIAEHLAHSPTLRAAARASGVPPRRLGAALKAATGYSFADYLAECRLRNARALLDGSSLPLKEVSHRSGFSHVSSFTTAFRRAVGMTPGQYRTRSR
jgi:AraC family transcriptional regulator